MILSNGKYGLCIEFRENEVNTLVVEKPEIMTDIVSGLYDQCNGGDGDFTLSIEGNIVKPNKALDLVLNPLLIKINDKKIINELYSRLELNAFDHIEEKYKINSEIIVFLEKIVSKIPYSSIDYALDFDWSGLFKLYNIHFDEDYDCLAGKVSEYIKILNMMNSVKLLCLVGIKAFLSEEEIMEVFRMAFYNKISLLLIESYDQKQLSKENVYIIDKDSCLIIK